MFDRGSRAAVITGLLVCVLTVAPHPAIGMRAAQHIRSPGIQMARWGTWSHLSLPPGAATTTNATVRFVACPAVGSCVAAGQYFDTGGSYLIFLASEVDGVWRRAVEPVLPADFAPSGDSGLFLTSLACAAPGDCVAGGSYQSSDGNTRGLLINETAGEWAPGTAAPALANTPAFSNSAVSELACPDAGNCEAVANFTAPYSAAGATPYFLTESSGVWTATPAPITTPDTVTVDGLACSAPGACTAVGDVAGPVGTLEAHAVVFSERDGVWHISFPPPPNGLPPGTPTQLTAVSCSVGGSCSAAGFANPSAPHGFDPIPIFDREADGGWRAVPGTARLSAVPAFIACPEGSDCASVAPTCCWIGAVIAFDYRGGPFVADQLDWPASVYSQRVYFNGLSCPSAGDCVAVGDQDASGYFRLPIVFVERHGKWQPGRWAHMPLDVGPRIGSTADLNAVSCPAPTSCTVVGSYIGRGHNQRTLVLTGSIL